MKKTIIAVLAAIIGLLGGYSATQLGSSVQGNDYHATTTPYLASWTDQTIKTGAGSLGSVVITKAGDLEFALYNATSSGAVNNDSRFNKTTNRLAAFDSTATVGTYVFDTEFSQGLVLEVVAGTTGTSTITFR